MGGEGCLGALTVLIPLLLCEFGKFQNRDFLLKIPFLGGGGKSELANIPSADRRKAKALGIFLRC